MATVQRTSATLAVAPLCCDRKNPAEPQRLIEHGRV